LRSICWREAELAVFFGDTWEGGLAGLGTGPVAFAAGGAVASGTGGGIGAVATGSSLARAIADASSSETSRTIGKRPVRLTIRIHHRWIEKAQLDAANCQLFASLGNAIPLLPTVPRDLFLGEPRSTRQVDAEPSARVSGDALAQANG